MNVAVTLQENGYFLNMKEIDFTRLYLEDDSMCNFISDEESHKPDARN